MCTPSGPEGHIGQERVPGERDSGGIPENYKDMQKHTLLKMCTPLRSKAHFGVIGAPGERQSPGYAELFVVALKRGLREPLWRAKVARMRSKTFEKMARGAPITMEGCVFTDKHKNQVF